MLVPNAKPTDVPPRETSYAQMPELSHEAFQLRVKPVGAIFEAARPSGTVGGVVSAGEMVIVTPVIGPIKHDV
jgi:hypothetical protein